MATLDIFVIRKQLSRWISWGLFRGDGKGEIETCESITGRRAP